MQSVQEQVSVAIDFHIQAKRQVLEQMAVLVNGMLMPGMVAQATVRGIHIQCKIGNAPAEEAVAVLQKINELAVKAGILPKEVADKMGDVKGCWRRPAMPPVIKRDMKMVRAAPVIKKVPEVTPEEFVQTRFGAPGPRRKSDQKKKRRRKMGEASALVGKHDHAPPTKKNRGYGSILERTTGILDDLDTAIQVKEKDLNTEVGKESENALKLGKLKAAEAMMRQARALLEDYGSGLDQDADVIPLPLDPLAWIKPGVLASHKALIEDWRVVSVEDLAAEGVVVKAHRLGFESIKIEQPIEDFDNDFSKSETKDDAVDDSDGDDLGYDPDEDFSNPDAG